MVSFDGKPWYEIDTIEDLSVANKLFSLDSDKVRKTLTLSQSIIFNMQLIKAVTSPLETTGIINATI